MCERVDFAWDATVLVGATGSVGGSSSPTAWVHEGWAPVAQLRVSVAVEGVSERAWVDAQFAAIVTDLVGSPVRVVGEDGAALWSGSASVWGLVPGHGSSVMPLRFPGQYVDDESGLFASLFRYDDPTTARFVSLDPLGLAPSPNPYAYPANPTTEIDPLGLSPCTPANLPVAYDADFALGQMVRTGRVRASSLEHFGEAQGWMRTQNANGPVKFTDSNGVIRLTIKRGTPRAPGSNFPHVEMRNHLGQRVDRYGFPVTRRSRGNHTPIDWDMP